MDKYDDAKVNRLVNSHQGMEKVHPAISSGAQAGKANSL